MQVSLLQVENIFSHSMRTIVYVLAILSMESEFWMPIHRLALCTAMQNTWERVQVVGILVLLIGIDCSNVIRLMLARCIGVLFGSRTMDTTVPCQFKDLKTGIFG